MSAACVFLPTTKEHSTDIRSRKTDVPVALTDQIAAASIFSCISTSTSAISLALWNSFWIIITQNQSISEQKENILHLWSSHLCIHILSRTSWSLDIWGKGFQHRTSICVYKPGAFYMLQKYYMMADERRFHWLSMNSPQMCLKQILKTWFTVIKTPQTTI